MENLKEETTCHIEALRNHDFGGTLNNVNGGLVREFFFNNTHQSAFQPNKNCLFQPARNVLLTTEDGTERP